MDYDRAARDREWWDDKIYGFIMLCVIAAPIAYGVHMVRQAARESIADHEERVKFWNTAPCASFGNRLIENVPARCVKEFQGCK